MAIRFNGTASVLKSSSGMPTTTSWTVAFWMYLVSAPGSGVILWSLDNTAATQVHYAVVTNASGNGIVHTWSAGGSTATAGSLSTATWYRVSMVMSGTTAKTYFGSAAGALTTYNNVGNYGLPTGTLQFWLGDNVTGGFYGNWRAAAWKLWNAALTKQEVEQELSSYVPQRFANLTHWYPFVRKELTDYSGNARTLTGGTPCTEEAGPPIPWTKLKVAAVPWDPTTTVWYAHYDTTSGELLSVGTVEPVPLPSGTALLELLGQPDLAQYEWSTTARTFVHKEGTLTADRVADLLADGTLTSAWADLSGADSTAMQNRIAQMLGPHRTRLDFQEPDLA